MYRLRWIIRALAAWLLAMVLPSCASADLSGGTNTRNTSAISGTLVINVPAQAQAGEAVRVRVGPVSAPDGTAVTLTTLGSYGPNVHSEQLTAGFATFELGADATVRSGMVTLVATAGSARGTAKLQIQSGPPVDPVTPLVGSRSILVGGQHWSMAVVIPFDRLENPVANGTSITLRVQHPDGSVEERAIATRYLAAWQRIYSSTVAGTTRVAVSASGAYGPEETLLEVATLPVSVTLSAEPPTLPANGQDLMTLRTDTLRDQFGNVLPDGTLVTFVIDEPDREPRRVPAYSLAGRAEVPIQAPIQPGTATVRAIIENVESTPLLVTFTPGPAVQTFPVGTNANAVDGVVTITAGPILGQLEQFVPDGTPVRITLISENGLRQQYTTISDNGRATLELRLAEVPSGSYTVEATAGSGQGSAKFIIPSE